MTVVIGVIGGEVAAVTETVVVVAVDGEDTTDHYL